MSLFTPVTGQLTRKRISKSHSKGCTLEPILLTKQCLHDLATLVTKLVDLSLSTGGVPSGLKQAVVKPHLQNEGLDTNDLNKFTPVSNLH